MNLKVISRNVGFALLVSALFMFLSVIVSVCNGNDSALAALTISFIITFVVGIFPLIFVRKTSAIALKDGYMIIALSWMLSFIFGMLPYLLWGGPFTVVNAFFESVSGFTTTGATILENVEGLPDSLLFWRSSTHFIGGLGVVVFLLLIIPSSNPIRLRLTNMELSALTKDGYQARANKTVFIFAYVYIAIAVLSFLCYWMAGMPAFDAVNHAFSIAATGGFSTKNLSIAAYGSMPISIITLVFMIVGSVHFGIIYMTVITRSLKPLDNPVLKFYLSALLIFTVIISGIFRIGGYYETLGDSVLHSAFHVASFASTTGFALSDSSVWPVSVSVLLAFLGLMCGMAGSTSGGAKADRFMLFFKAAVNQIRLSIHPFNVRELRVGKQIVHYEMVYPQILYIGLYCGIIVVSVLSLMACGMGSANSFYASISCMGNVGPAGPEMGTFGNFNEIPIMAKLICAADMFLGRVEIYPVLSVLALAFEKRK